ncbi:hypothetical protein AB0D33_41100 [Streptomyces sp. NPDC048404]|uniref:hypothetical protein n=1 Tax=unclassified Streptomyces TaxID=2593676 RepID=UPI0034408E04
MVIELTVRRFKRLSGWCPAVTFVEQIDGLTRPHARQTQALRSILASIALCLAGRPDGRLAAALAIRIAKDALLDLLRSVPQPPVGAVRFLATDAWHLWRSIAEAMERTVGSHHGCIRAAFADPVVMAKATAGDLVTPEPSEAVAVPFFPPDGTLDVMGRPRRLVARAAEGYAAVQVLPADGQSLARIGRTPRLDRSTVRRFARASSLKELPATAQGAPEAPPRNWKRSARPAPTSTPPHGTFTTSQRARTPRPMPVRHRKLPVRAPE